MMTEADAERRANRSNNDDDEDRNRRLEPEQHHAELIPGIPDEDRNRRLEAEQHHAELIPGIPDDVTLFEICRRLPSTVLHTLRSLSPAWEEAVRNRHIYEARVRTGSTDKHLVINNRLPNGTFGIALYSLRAKAILQLPPIPRVKTGIPQSCQCVTLDGKIYILGGVKKPEGQVCSKDVYVWDAAGQPSWKKCASMRMARCNFGSGVIDGKIYVCGGSSCRKPVRVPEAYDPQTDAWTTLAPMPSSRTSHQVGIWGGELLVYGGAFFRPNFLELQAEFGRSVVEEPNYTVPALHIEVYNPIDDQWRRGSEDTVHLRFHRLFMVEGRLHAIGKTQIGVYDREQNTWTHLQRVSRDVDRVEPSRRLFWPRAVLAMDGELFVIDAVLDWLDLMVIELRILFPRTSLASRTVEFFTILNKSTAFGIPNTQVKWRQEVYSLSFKGLHSIFIQPLQL